MSRLRKSRMTPSQQACEACRKKEDSDGFEVRYIDDYIGHGTFVTRDFAKGDFLLQYRGEVISQSEGESRQESYPVEKGSFLYFFQDKGNSLCVDGTNSDGACRMVNDAPLKKSNSQMKVISVDGTPCLCLFAREDIAAGQELRYDYGDESVPWRQKNIDHQSFDHEFPERWASQLQQLKTSAKQKHVGQVAFSRQLAIAEGCNGSKIYLGFFGEKQLPVAVKRVNSDHVGKEVEILQSLQGKHLTNVLQTFCVEHDEDFTYLASELCEMNIQEVVEATLPFADKHRTDEGRKKLCLGFLNGLRELHSLGIVHRDIKPANALIDTKGDVKIADFGVSRRMMGQTTLFTQSIGTICWMAIESLQGEMVKYKKSSDIQMTGCLVYYILSDGHIPHETAIPYTKEPEGVVRNLKAGTFHLEHLGSFLYMQPLIREMVSSEEKDRPSIEFCLEKFQDLSKQTLQVSSTKGTSLVASLLTSKEQRKVKQLARETACAYTRDFDSFTTHVVIPTDDNQLAKERSLKFLQGIAARVWIISFKWITESLERRQMLPEKDFEVKGDTVMGKTHGPERARLWQAEALLHTHVAYVLGASAKLPKDCVLTLLKMCGATTVDSSSKLTSVSQNLIRVVIDCVHDTDYPFDSAIKDLCTKYEVPIVTKEWLLDSIGSYTIQPFQKYQLEDETSGGQSSAKGNTASVGRTSTLEELDLSEKEAYSENLGIDCEISVSGSDMISSQASDKVGASSDICSDSESEYEPSGTSSDESEESCPQSPKRICKREEEGVTLSPERGTQEMGGDHVRYWKRNPPHQNRGCDSAGEETVPASNIVSTDHADKESTEAFVLDVTTTKYTYCLYCGTKQRKISRHCKRVHSGETLVSEVLALPKDSKAQKRQKWQHIGNLGNHEHNLEVLKNEKHDLIVRKRPRTNNTEKHSVQNYVPCSTCFGYFHAKTLWKHKEKCPRQFSEGKRTSNHVREGRMLLPTKISVSLQLQHALRDMKNDKLSLIVRNDREILQVGGNVLGVSNSNRREDKARERMRTLGKILSISRDLNDNINQAKDLVLPSSFDNVVEAALTLSGYNYENQTYEAYSTALRVGFALTDLAVVVKNNNIRDQNRDNISKADDFLHLLKSEWRVKVSACAQRQQQEKAWKAPKILPLTEDCMKLNNFLKKREEHLKADIRETGMSTTTYRDLARITLTQVILYNRRRPKEVELLTVRHYKESIESKRPVQDEVKKSLTAPEKIALKRLSLIMVRGKRGRGVPILLPPHLRESMDLLAHYNKDREFLFSRTSEGASTPIRAYQVVSDLASVASPRLKHPENMRCTKLRKHLATLSQLIDLKKNELEQLATHMGHDISVHREYYRLPMETVLLAKMSKLLHLAHEGKTAKYKGKSLQDIDVELNESIPPISNNEVSESEGESEEDEIQEQELRCDDVHITKSQKKAPGKVKNLTKHTDYRVKDGKMGETYLRHYNRWSSEQEKFLRAQKELQIFFKTKKAPGKSLCMLILKRGGPLLESKTWMEVRNKVHNLNNKAKAKLKKMELQAK